MPTTKLQQLGVFFQQRPHVWLGARELEFAGRQAWRTRVSECRTQLGLNIENRVRRVKGVKDGRCYDITVSEYRCIPTPAVELLRVFDRGVNPHCEGCDHCDGEDRDDGECTSWPLSIR